MSANENTGVTAAQRYGRQRAWRSWLGGGLFVLLILFGIVPIVVGAVLLWRFSGDSTPYYGSLEEHFKYGSIGSEPASGLPYWLWQALPHLYPETFEGRSDYTTFGFLYETDDDGEQRDLPIGVSRREVRGVEVVWLNCAVCHTGLVTPLGADAPRVVTAMPSNHLDLYGFLTFVLGMADDPQLAPDRVFEAIESAGGDLGPLERLIWRHVLLPRVREELIARAAAVLPLFEAQPPWGPGRVDTFNPYKMLQFGARIEDLPPEERYGVADFPSIFLQAPRDGMWLHWDGNNDSLQERNLSAAIGAGVTPETVDHEAIGRVATWLMDLPPPPSPYDPDDAAVAAGREIYMDACAACHGYLAEDGSYVFTGEYLGEVTPIAEVGTDPGRLDSYTAQFAEQQTNLFAGTPYQFSRFQKTDGYANQPLDGLWLRAPYLHNGSVPTLADLLSPPDERPDTFLRGPTELDEDEGGFQAPPCDPDDPGGDGFCLDTALPGNGNGGHLWGTDLPSEQKADLLAYLLTF